MSSSSSAIYERCKYNKGLPLRDNTYALTGKASIYKMWSQIRSQAWITECTRNRSHFILYIQHNLLGRSYIRNLNTLHFTSITGYHRLDYPLQIHFQQYFMKTTSIFWSKIPDRMQILPRRLDHPLRSQHFKCKSAT